MLVALLYVLVGIFTMYLCIARLCVVCTACISGTESADCTGMKRPPPPPLPPSGAKGTPPPPPPLSGLKKPPGAGKKMTEIDTPAGVTKVNCSCSADTTVSKVM